MNYHHFTILFAMIFAAYALRIGILFLDYEQKTDYYTQLGNRLYIASGAAADVLMEQGKVAVDNGVAFDTFMDIMYASLGIIDNPAQRQAFMDAVMLFAVFDGEKVCVRLAKGDWEKEDWSEFIKEEKVNQPGIIVAIQGYPNYIFVKGNQSEIYYLTEKEWYQVYHREKCEILPSAEVEEMLHTCVSVKDCVKAGAYACERCIRNGVHAPSKIYLDKEPAMP